MFKHRFADQMEHKDKCFVELRRTLARACGLSQELMQQMDGRASQIAERFMLELFEMAFAGLDDLKNAARSAADPGARFALCVDDDMDRPGLVLSLDDDCRPISRKERIELEHQEEEKWLAREHKRIMRSLYGTR